MGGRCGADEMVEGLEDVGGGGETEVGGLCAVAIFVVVTALGRKAEHIVSKEIVSFHV